MARKHWMIFTVSAGAVVLLAGCGSVRDLTPAEGASLPPAPYGATERPAAEALMEPSAQARPERNAEIRRRSERREDDVFDLAPE